MAKTTVMLEAALEYAKRGFKVFPCEEYGKQPRIPTKEAGRGVHDATTSKQQIETWWNRWPNANIGLHAESFFVLDVDTKSGGPDSLIGLERQYGALPATLTQTTPSGGKHYLFKAPAGVLIQNRAGFYPGLDTRAYGGYILAAPSRIGDAQYTWDNDAPIADAPEWLVTMVKKNREQYRMAARSDTGSRDVDDASLAGALHNLGFNEDEMIKILQFRNNNPERRDVPLPTNEIIKTVRSIAKRDVHTPVGLMQAIQENSRRVKLEKPDHEPDVTWVERGVQGANGALKNCVANAEAAVINSPVFCNTLCFDTLRQEALIKRNIVDPINGQTIGNLTAGTLVTDYVVTEMLIIAQRLIPQVTFSEEIFGRAIQVAARHYSFNPVQDYLNSLLWDDTTRIDSFLVDYFGCEDTAYTRGVGRRWLISAIQRALNPGCIANSMLILEGRQDAAKSKALKALAGPEFFKDTPIDLSHKDRFGALKGVWIYELAEFDQYKGSDAARMKSFISSQVDSYRPPYYKTDVQVPRSSIFVGTVNPDKYLTDPTGNKRYWPVKNVKNHEFNPIDCDKIERVRDQIWAEAVRAYYNGEAAYIDNNELRQLHAAEAEQRVDNEDVWDEAVLTYMQGCKKKIIHTSDILSDAISVPLDRQGNREKERIKRILTQAGYKYVSMRDGQTITRSWRKHEQLGLS